MKMSLPRTKMLDEAKKSKSENFIVVILTFVAVFILGTLLQTLFVGPMEMKYLFSTEEMKNITQAYSRGEIQMQDMIERITRFATSNMPDYLTIVSLFATVGGIIAAVVYCKFYEKRTLASMGFRKKNAIAEYLVGALVGVGIFSAAIAINVLTGAMRFDSVAVNIKWGTIALFFLGFLVQGMSEEIICRGYLMISLSRTVPVAAAIGLSAVAFAVLHLGNNGIAPLAFINLTLFGVFAGVYMLKRGNIWGVCAMHSLWNFVQGNFYGLSVSGMGDLATVFRFEQVQSHDLMNGGSFGPEGGLGVTIVYSIAIVIMLFTKTKQSELSEEKAADEQENVVTA